MACCSRAACKRSLPTFPTRRSSDLRGRARSLAEHARARDGATLAGILAATAGAPVSLALAERRRRRPWDGDALQAWLARTDRKSTRLNSSHGYISYAVFCLKKNRTV